MRLPIACLITPALVAQAPSTALPDPAEILPGIRQPLLLVFAPPPSGRDLTQAQLAAEEALDGVFIQSVSLTEAGPDALSFAKAIRAYLKLGDARWALVLEGRVLAQGIPPITLPALKTLVEGSGFKTPTQQLRAFLKRRPDHLEARQSLLQHMLRRAEVRTQEALGTAALAQPLPKERGLLTAFDHLPKADARLKPEDDLRIWGEIYRELDRVLQNGDWLCMTLDQLMGERRPLEAASPLMRGLYQRHRPQILATLRETPQDRNALSFWAHTSVVLGEPLAPFLESLTPPPPPIGFSSSRSAWPGEPIRKLLACEARRQQDWPRLARLLSRIWMDGQEDRQINRHQGTQFWTRDWRAYGLPALEAQIRARTPEGAEALLDAASDAPNASELLTEAASLAQRLGRGDLAKAWLQRPQPRKKPKELDWNPYLLVTTSRNRPRLLVNAGHAQNLGRRSVNTHSLQAQANGPDSSTHAWHQFLGWSPQDQRWAFLDRTGKVLLEGPEPMDQAQTQKTLDALNLTWEEQPPPNPTDLWSRTEDHALKLREVIQVAEGLTLQPATRMGAPKEPDPARAAACLEQLRAMDDLLEGGLWRRSTIHCPAGYPGLPSSLPEVSAIARTWTQALESELVRRPRSHGLWSFWRQWVALVPDPDFSGLEGRLERNPMEVGRFWDQAWPPPLFVTTQIEHHRFHGQWRKLEQLVSPRWDKARSDAETRKDPDAARTLWNQFGVYLAQALWKQDRVADADRLFSEALGLGLDRAFLARAALNHDFKDLAAHWDPPKTGPDTNRSTQP